MGSGSSNFVGYIWIEDRIPSDHLLRTIQAKLSGEPQT
jgi:hypothetical protein